MTNWIEIISVRNGAPKAALGLSLVDGRWHCVITRKRGKNYPRSTYCQLIKGVWHDDNGVRLPRGVIVTHVSHTPVLPEMKT